MRLTIFTFLSLILSIAAAQAQSVTDNLPPVIIQGSDSAEKTPAKETATFSDPYTVVDVKVDVTADTAAHARDRALMQAERLAYAQLCKRSGEADTSAKLSDDEVAALVKSFEVQNERVSAVRYIGVFTIRFNPSIVQKIITVPDIPIPVIETSPTAQGSASHVTINVSADSLVAWTQIKRRLETILQVTKVDTLSLGRGLIRIDVSYNGSFDELSKAVGNQGLVLRQNGSGAFDLYDGSLVPR